MTCEYSNINQHDALYNTARDYPGGIEALAARMGVSANVLRNKLRPSIETHKANFEDVSRLIEMAEEARVPSTFAALHAFCWRHGHVATPMPSTAGVEVDVPALMRQAVACVGIEGRLFSDINEALADDAKIDRRELQALELTMEQLLGALVVLRDQVRTKHRADFAQ